MKDTKMRYQYAVVEAINPDNKPIYLDVCIDTKTMLLEAVFVEDSEVDITFLINPSKIKSITTIAIDRIQNNLLKEAK
jgi:hypothetical protein